jgi:hypothetical protein
VKEQEEKTKDKGKIEFKKCTKNAKRAKIKPKGCVRSKFWRIAGNGKK